MPLPPYIRRRSFIGFSLATTVDSIINGQSPALAGVDDSTNPPWMRGGLPYNAPPFDRIVDSDLRPAILAAIARQRQQVEAVAGNPRQPSFENTLAALERATAPLDCLKRLLATLVSTNANEALEAVQTELAPALQSSEDTIYFHEALFHRIRLLHQQRKSLGLDAASEFLLETTYDDFVRNGAALSVSEKASLSSLNEQIAILTVEFEQRLRLGRNASAVAVRDRSELDGLDEAEIAAAEVAGSRLGSARYLLELRNTTQQAQFAKLKNRSLRRQILSTSEARGNNAGPFDQRDLISDLAWLRAQKAKLLGFRSFAAYTLAAQVAKSPEAATDLLRRVVPLAMAKVRAQVQELQALIDHDGGGFQLAAYDWPFYAERLRQQRYASDDEAIRPFFELDRVLRDGVFLMAARLYGLSFRERHDIPVYHSDVRTFELLGEQDGPLGLLYADFFSRPNKQGGAWCNNMLPPSEELGQKPVMICVTNFTKPLPGEPALLRMQDVFTIFHEFGHALHTSLSVQRFYSQNGFSMPTDVVEFPSQFSERLALEPGVIDHYARHYQTGEPLAREVVDRLRDCIKFDKAYETTEYLASALLDLAWHSLPADAPRQSSDWLEETALSDNSIRIAEVPPVYKSTYFAHIWSGGYEANYYSYLWAQVLAEDAFAWFGEHGGLTRSNGERFRDLLLSRGYTADPMELYRSFRGRDPDAKFLLRSLGLTQSL